MRVPPPPIVAASASGFVLGVLLTLAATGTILRPSRSPVVPTLQPHRQLAQPSMYQQVKKLAERQLGPGLAGAHQQRFISLTLAPATGSTISSDRPSILPGHWSIILAFRLNDHPLGPTWRLRAAKADVFGLLRALYTSALPIYNVELEGFFPIKQGKKTQTREAVTAFISHTTANGIPWKHWGREYEARLWSRLDYAYADRRFG